MPPRKTKAQPKKTEIQMRKMYLEKMERFQLTKEWQDCMDAVWRRNGKAKIVDWRKEGILPPVQKHTRPVCVSTSVCSCVSAHYFMRTGGSAPAILSLESIARGVFDERALKARMDVIKKDREDVLVGMGKMRPDCDISVVDVLRYACRFGLPLEEDWPFGQPAPVRPLDKLHKFMVHDYRELEGADEVSIKHMLKQSQTIYTREDNRRRRKIELHAMVLVGWGCDVEGKEYYIVMSNWGREWGDEGYGYLEKELIDAVYYPMILPLKTMPPPIDL
ncbi:unnamed protein product [Malus baccata var. baccata]